jgi:uncharacterized membrane protein
MNLVLLLQKLLVFGCLGILIEFFFTSIHSLLVKNWKATGYSYLWMLPIYGFTALALEGISDAVPWPFFLKAFLYVPVIYGVEALSGWTLQRLIGHIPWDYQKSKWTPMGLINLKYAPFWLLLAMAFDAITEFLNRLLKALTLVTS